MIRTKRRVMVSISYFDFDFGDDLIAANAFANVARATITDQGREVELKTNYYYFSLITSKTLFLMFSAVKPYSFINSFGLPDFP